MTKDVIPGSRNKAYSAQQALVASRAKSSGHPYQLPHLLEGTVSILMHHAKHGEPLYKDKVLDLHTLSSNVSCMGAFLLLSEALVVQRGSTSTTTATTSTSSSSVTWWLEVIGSCGPLRSLMHHQAIHRHISKI